MPTPPSNVLARGGYRLAAKARMPQAYTTVYLPTAAKDSFWQGRTATWQGRAAAEKPAKMDETPNFVAFLRRASPTICDGRDTPD